MMAVSKDFQNKGVGARLKWAQREKALSEGRSYIKWTWDPMQARNAHFNLNRLGATVREYADNLYGTDYLMDPTQDLSEMPGVQGDRLFASWDLNSPRVSALASGGSPTFSAPPAESIPIPADWRSLIRSDVVKARAEQTRVRNAFQAAFGNGLICAGFERGEDQPRYLLYQSKDLTI
jgi:predicted GNAT superfamily acetyltransferase